MGYGDLSCYGGTAAKTPNIDRLASEGIRFTRFYINAPICSPSRVAFTTGQYPNRWGITSYLATHEEDRKRGINDWLSPQAPTLARFLHEAGYYTAHVGKWHMGGQRDVGEAPLIREYGFDASLTSFEGLGERVLPVFERKADGSEFIHPPTRMNAELGGGPIHWIDRHQVTKVFVDRAMKEIRTAREQHKPFYLNLWPDDVHSPVQAPPELRGDGSVHSQYAGVVVELDKQVGRVFDLVRSDPDLRDNTIIVVASDNGPEAGYGVTGGLRGGKGNLYEGGIRSPLIVWSARIAREKAGSTNATTLIAGMDLAPSILAITHTPVAPSVHFDGQDMSAAMLGESSVKRSTPVMWVRPPDRPGPLWNRWPDLAIHRDQWKLLVNRDSSNPQLYDIDTDSNETKNLADEHPEVAGELSQQVIAWDRSIHPATTAPISGQ